MKQRFDRPDGDLDDEDELILRGGNLDPSIIRRDAQRMFDIRVLGLRLEPTGRSHRHYTLMLRSLDEDVAALVSADHHVWMNPYHEA